MAETKKTTTSKKSVFDTLYNINVNEHTEQKNGLTYLSWAWAWAEVKKKYPDAQYHICMFGEADLPYVYDPNTGYMVFTDMTINGITHEMWLPVMDNNNKAMKSEEYKFTTRYNKEVTVKQADMFDVNKTIMRCLVKNLAMFGLGLYIYAGEDIPKETPEQIAERKLNGEAVELPTGEDFAKAMKCASTQQITMIKTICERIGQPTENICKKYKVKELGDLSPEQATEIIEKLKEAKK